MVHAFANMSMDSLASRGMVGWAGGGQEPGLRPPNAWGRCKPPELAQLGRRDRQVGVLPLDTEEVLSRIGSSAALPQLPLQREVTWWVAGVRFRSRSAAMTAAFSPAPLLACDDLLPPSLRCRPARSVFTPCFRAATRRCPSVPTPRGCCPRNGARRTFIHRSTVDGPVPCPIVSGHRLWTGSRHTGTGMDHILKMRGCPASGSSCWGIARGHHLSARGP